MIARRRSEASAGRLSSPHRHSLRKRFERSDAVVIFSLRLREYFLDTGCPRVPARLFEAHGRWLIVEQERCRTRSSRCRRRRQRSRVRCGSEVFLVTVMLPAKSLSPSAVISIFGAIAENNPRGLCLRRQPCGDFDRGPLTARQFHRRLRSS